MSAITLDSKFFKHYKGLYYYVVGESIHTETDERFVNYISLYATYAFPYGQMWSRPHDMFCGKIDDGRPRFVEVTKDKMPDDVLFDFEEYASKRRMI